MSSYLTFSPAAGSRGSFELDEAESMAMALVQRLKEGSMPPDDAYWWARAVYFEYDSLGMINNADASGQVESVIPQETGMTIAVVPAMIDAFAGMIPDETPSPVPLKTMT